MMNNIKKKAKDLITFFLSLIADVLSYCIPTKKSLVIFGGLNGKYYGDNSRYVFEKALKECPKFKCVWLTRNKQIVRELKTKGLPVYSVYSLLGIWTLFRANIGLYTNNLTDLSLHSSFSPRKLKLIALRHGRSVKRVRFAMNRPNFTKEEIRILKRETKMIKYAISTSDFISKVQEEVLKIGLDKHIVTGYPRNDVLFNPTDKMKKDWEDFLQGETYNKVILYGPTWRHGRNPTKFFPFEDLNLDDLNDLLKNKNSLILIRPHKNELNIKETKKFLDYIAYNYSNIKLATHIEFPSVNDLLPFCDAFICDYSALYHDFLLLDRPLIFIPYDYELFEKENGFLYDYFKYLPGPAVLNYIDFKKELLNVINNNDDYVERRRRLTNLIHEYKDGNSTSRVIELIYKIYRGEN